MMEPASELAAQLHNLADRDFYLQAAGELLFALFPSEGIGWTELDGAARTAKIFAYPDMPLDGKAESLVETAGDNPFFRSYLDDLTAGMWQPRRLSDLATDLELHRTRTYREGLRPLGIDRQIAMLSDRIGPVRVRAWTINRLRWDFTDTEVELAQRLQPPLRLLELAYGESRAKHLEHAYAKLGCTNRIDALGRLRGR